MKRLLLALFAGALTISSCYGQMYCEPDDCYTLLGLDRYDSPTKADIKQAYRNLSKKLHPDRNLNDPTAADKFAKVAKAYEVLVDDETREEYHYARDHPEEYLANSYRYYTRVYAPKADPRFVLLAIVCGLSALQYTLQLLMYKNNKYQLRNYNPKFLQEVKKIAKERLDEEKKSDSSKAGAISSKSRKQQKKSSQEEQIRLLQIEKEVGDELIETVQVEGGYSLPTITDLFAVKVLKLPYTFPKWCWFHGLWQYRHSYLGLPYERHEKIYLLVSELGRSEDALRDEYTDEEFEQLLETECWKRENFLKFQENQFRLKYPERYKQYLRWKKSEKQN